MSRPDPPTVSIVEECEQRDVPYSTAQALVLKGLIYPCEDCGESFYHFDNCDITWEQVEREIKRVQRREEEE